MGHKLTHDGSTVSPLGEATITHQVVYDIESRPTKGSVKLALKSE
ncbi:hypothetical protein [Brevibacterium sp. 1718]